jgi:hypothetical protein
MDRRRIAALLASGALSLLIYAIFKIPLWSTARAACATGPGSKVALVHRRDLGPRFCCGGRP